MAEDNPIKRKFMDGFLTKPLNPEKLYQLNIFLGNNIFP